MGFVPVLPPFRPNVDKDGQPLDYATYVWLRYGLRVADDSPARVAFLFGPRNPQPDTVPLFTNARLILDE